MFQWWCVATGVPWVWKWQAYPGVWAFILIIGFAFTRVQARWGSEEDGRRAIWFYVALASLWIALDWPVGALGAGYLASVHMVQYLLIALIAPPLILIGLPRGIYRAMMAGPLSGLVRLVSQPLVSIFVFVGIMAWTHWPPVVDVLMVTQTGSFFLDVIWLFSGLVFWWPVVAPEPQRSWLGDPFRIGYLIVATLVNTGVFAYLTFSPLPLYATYELAPPVTGLSTRDDQLLAGLFMKMGGAVIIWTAISILFFRWVNREVDEEGRDHLKTAGTVGLALMLAVGMSACSPSDGGSDSGADSSEESAEVAESAMPRIERAVIGRPPTSDRAALYLHIRNPGDTPIRLTDVIVHGVGAESFHQSSTEGGMMSMTPLNFVDLPANSLVTMAPGGLHIMLEELSDEVLAGETVQVTLKTSTGGLVMTNARFVPLAELESALGN